jgi:GNAT superfamily N-acetyltransferase
VVREAVQSDYENLHRLFIEENRYTFAIAPEKTAITDEVLSRSELEQLIESGSRFVGVYEEQNDLLGLIFAKHIVEPASRWAPKNNSVYIEILFVSENSRNRGIGAELLKLAKAWAVSLGANSIELDVWNESVAAVNLYEKFGLKCRRSYMSMELTEK